MKRNTLVFGLLAIAMGAMAQVKLSPQAQMSIARHQAKAVKAAARANAAGQQPGEEKGVTLVVTTDGEPTPQTFGSLRAAGAKVLSRLGRQAVVSVPVDSVASLARIQGLKRIDSGHKGRLKTDIARRETGVSQLNGPTVADGVLTFIIADEGVPFDPTQKEEADVTLGLEERPIGGLGIFLCKQIMDTVGYERREGRNILTLTKKL